MKKTSIMLLLSTLFIFIGCGDNSNDETITMKEVTQTEKEKLIAEKKEANNYENLGVHLNIEEENETVDIQVGDEKGGVKLKMGENGIKLNVGDKDGGISINLGLFSD